MTDLSGSLNLAFKAGSSVEGGTGRYDGSPKESPHQSRSGRGRGFLGCPPWEVEAGPVQDHTRNQRCIILRELDTYKLAHLILQSVSSRT
jgi:hypothetical protein